jgi:tyrosyl-tRNA synthetase
MQEKGIFDVLEERGFIEQITDEDQVRDLFSKKSVPFYIGIDPTADSLHIGHFMSVIVASKMQEYGHKPIILVGGGTAQIGDPSGKSDMRKMLSKEDIEKNIAGIKAQLEKYLKFDGENGAIIVNNGDWINDLKYLEFMRDIGSKFTVTRMLAADAYKQRIANGGLTFFEMGYMLLQSYDFLKLYEKYGCKLELGGNDQWSNIIGGVELIRKLGHADAYGLTFKLLLTKDGVKMGKTVNGALWLDPERTSPYEFYQYWRNVADEDVENCMKLLTDISLEDIAKYVEDIHDAEKINHAKSVLAYEVTKRVHGEENARQAEESAKALFNGQGDISNMPETNISDAIGKSILDVLVEINICPSKGQAKQLIAQGGVSLNDEKISDITYTLKDSDFNDGFAIIKKGKKIFHKISL